MFYEGFLTELCLYMVREVGPSSTTVGNLLKKNYSDVELDDMHEVGYYGIGPFLITLSHTPTYTHIYHL